MSDFIDEAIKYVRSGQTAFYVNSREESRVIAAIREVGWRLAGDSVVFDDDSIDKFASVGLEEQFWIDKKLVPIASLIELLAQAERTVSESEEEEKLLTRKISIIREFLDSYGYNTVTWDMVAGFNDNHSIVNFVDALARIDTDDINMLKRCLVIIKDSHAHLTNESTAYRRALRNLCEDNRLVTGTRSRHLFFLQPYMRPHEDIRHCLVRLDFPLPRDEEIDREITSAQHGIVDASKRECDSDLRVQIVSSLRGLDTANIAKTLSYCAVDFKGFVPEIVNADGSKRKLINTIRSMRSRQLSTGQGLRIIDPDDPELTMAGNLGGYENVRELADRVMFCRSKIATDLKVKAPNGFGLAGPPGTGKTVCAKLFAHWIDVPLCIVNLGTLKEGLVGASENNTAAALETIRALGDCAVLFDEWDKQSGGIVGSATDGNTSLGMLSLILDFASDPRRKAFLIFTMNRLHGPIESLRAGRIDRFFYTPLPDATEREEILMIKLTESGAEIPKQLREIASDDVTLDLSGSELVSMVNEAIAISAQRDGKKAPTVADLRAAREVVTPVTKLNRDEINAMADFKGVAISVSKERKKLPVNNSQPNTRRSIKIDPDRN